MPDHVVILFMFGVLTSFGMIWLANELRLRTAARYLEYNFYFILSALCYGFANWIAPFVIMDLMETAGTSDPAWFIVIFVLISVPILLIKLFFLFLLVQELLARERPAWFNKSSLLVSLAVLLLTVWAIKSFYDNSHMEMVRSFIVTLGLLVVAYEFFIITRYLVCVRKMETRVLGTYSLPFGWVFLTGFTIYVLVAYSASLRPGSLVVELTPYVYFIIHGLPLLVLWLFHQNEPATAVNTDIPNIIQFIEEHGLTAKEADILRQIIRGASNREIAEKSFISPNTVRNHIYNIYNKTGIRNRFQLLALCQPDESSLVD